ncbi:hypothetical protein ANCCAN_20354 [Ancylostoma caninum]|uniref:7TM GPCR serpentine receptor class x (Srx) domain-containing protein n=1 Tax=Ancylostoma caninum TaxID=29170 RepID=A0A368FSM5_ANCCA|nr:hypothetical protein ANCCAN_20354 [Ancylostoma caninum]
MISFCSPTIIEQCSGAGSHLFHKFARGGQFKKEHHLFCPEKCFQGCLSAINQALGIFFYHYFIRNGSTNWERFAGTSLIFQFCHITDALITIIFIKPVRDQLCRTLHIGKERETTRIIVVKDSAH